MRGWRVEVVRWEEEALRADDFVITNSGKQAAACRGQENGRWVVVNPLEHQDWNSMVNGLPGSTVFHGAAWARVLHETYGHSLRYICTFDGTRLTAALPLMEASKCWLGRRGVSLPFTDVCPALSSGRNEGAELYAAAMREGERRRWKSMECRGEIERWKGARASRCFYEHLANLEEGPDRLYGRFEPAVRRGIRKAERQGLGVEFGAGMEETEAYYALHCLTRRRHGAPPQPFAFFRSIQRHLLAAGQGFIVLIKLGPASLAGGMFLCTGKNAVYKFGASDGKAQAFRPNNLMMWAGISRCAEMGARTLSFGRTSLDNIGLRRFKLGFGAWERRVEYAKYDFKRRDFVREIDWAGGWSKAVFRALPIPLLRLAGEWLYPCLT